MCKTILKLVHENIGREGTWNRSVRLNRSKGNLSHAEHLPQSGEKVLLFLLHRGLGRRGGLSEGYRLLLRLLGLQPAHHDIKVEPGNLLAQSWNLASQLLLKRDFVLELLLELPPLNLNLAQKILVLDTRRVNRLR